MAAIIFNWMILKHIPAPLFPHHISILLVSPEEISTQKIVESLIMRCFKSCGILERSTAVSLSESLHTISECLEPVSVLKCPSNF